MASVFTNVDVSFGNEIGEPIHWGLGMRLEVGRPAHLGLGMRLEVGGPTHQSLGPRLSLRYQANKTKCIV